MSQYLEMLEKMKDLRIVKFFAQFFTQSGLSPLANDLKDRADSGTIGSLATQLVVWAVILAIGAFAIDQAFYWTRPGQRDKARETWQGFKDGAAGVFENARAFTARLRSGEGRRAGKEPPRGRQ